jgi:clan AA aspartic protease
MDLQGVVNELLEATVRLSLVDSAGGLHEVDVVVDTGFNGFLTLQWPWIQHLGLRFITSSTAELADGSIITLPKYEATVAWGGRKRRVPVLQSESSPLAGMLLFRNCHLSIDVRSGGVVRAGRID